MSAELLALSDIPFIPLAIPQEVAAEKVLIVVDQTYSTDREVVNNSVH
jgi:hypothetical protein